MVPCQSVFSPVAFRPCLVRLAIGLELPMTSRQLDITRSKIALVADHAPQEHCLLRILIEDRVAVLEHNRLVPGDLIDQSVI